MVELSTAGGSDEQNAREGNDGRVSQEDKMEYLVVLVITLVVIAYILDDNDKKQSLSFINLAIIVSKSEKGRLQPSLFAFGNDERNSIVT